MDRSVLEKKALAELREIAATLELRGYQRMKKADLVSLIIDAATSGNGASSGSASGSASGAAATQGELVPETTTEADGTGRADAESGSSPKATREAAADTEGGAQAETAARETRTDDAARVRARRRGSASRSDDGSADDSNGRSPRVRDGRDTGRSDDGSSSSRESSSRESSRESSSRDQAREQRAQARAQSSDAPSDQGRGGSSDQDDDSDDGESLGSRNRAKRERRRKGRTQQGQGQQGQGGQQENLEDAEVREGVLDLLPEGYGFLRVTGYLSGDRDVYVSQSFVRRFELRRGDRVAGPIRRNKNNDKFPALARVDTVEGEPLEQGAVSRRADFKDLTPLFPTERLKLDRPDAPMAMRLVDMMAPIGKGQRGLLVSPPKAGKTTVLKQLAAAIEANNPDVHLMVVLVDERPEEVTDFERSCSGEVISSTFDRPAEDHTQVAELAIERAKRLVERGKDVVILLDSITRLGRAYNLAAPASGRILSGGIDSAALYPPKRFFGAARNIEQGGSLTIIATALIETGSRMDEVIFEEFKGTGNMELRLDRRMEQKRIFPAIDIAASGTRREELLLPADRLEIIWKLRRLLATMDGEAALQLLIDKLKATTSNEQFIQMIARSTLQ